jgi:cobalamin biosynthetic protein CobC
VIRCAPENAVQTAAGCDVLLLCNPNNPTGHRYATAELLVCHAELAARGGWLVVDEAFIDIDPQHSLAQHIGPPGLIVLRSLGKFFGLAGARVGFILAWPALLAQIEEALGPWPVSGPARMVAASALHDQAWQESCRQRLLQDAQRLSAMLAAIGLPPAGGTALFQWVATPRAEQIHDTLANQGILTRLFREPASLRFGLPVAEPEWMRLAAALSLLKANS